MFFSVLFNTTFDYTRGLRTKMTDGSGMDTCWSYYTDTSLKPLAVKGVYWKTAGQNDVEYSIHYDYWSYNDQRKIMTSTNGTSRIQKLAYYYDALGRVVEINDNLNQVGDGTYIYEYESTAGDMVTGIESPWTSGATYPAARQEYTYDTLGRRKIARVGVVYPEPPPPEMAAMTEESTEAVESNVYTETGPQSYMETLAAETQPLIPEEPDSMLLSSWVSLVYQTTNTYYYNSSGQRCKQILTDGKHIEYDYDQYGQMTEALKYDDTTPQADYQYSYAYDGIGNKVDTSGEIRGDLVFDFTHNTLNQMTYREWEQSQTLSGEMSLPSSSEPGTYETTTVNGRKAGDGSYEVELSQGGQQIAGPIAPPPPPPPDPDNDEYTYDSNGNLTDIIRSYDTDTTLTYDDENRLDDLNGLMYNHTGHR